MAIQLANQQLARLPMATRSASVSFGARTLTDFQKKNVIYGGTFNPFHHHHALIVEKVLQQYKPERLVIMPAADPPHKKGVDVIDFKHRVGMLKALYKDRPEIVISDIESTLPKPSYTLNTLRSLIPGFDTLYDRLKEKAVLIIGGDSKDKIASWFGAETLIKNTLFLVASRSKKAGDPSLPPPGTPSVPVKDPEGLDWDAIEIPESDLSSTEIRQKVRGGISLEGLKALVPEPIARYILAEKLYLDPPASQSEPKTGK